MWFISLPFEIETTSIRPPEAEYNGTILVLTCTGSNLLIQVIAHRGASFDFPENTLSAFQAACIPGVLAIEFDVQLSRDGVPVVCHDETFERIGLGPKRCVELESTSLRRLDAGGWFDPKFSNQRIPVLAEVVEAITDRELWIEIKVYGRDWESGRTQHLINTIVDGLDRAEAGDRARILSFHRPTLEYLYHRAPEIRRVWNLKRPISLDAITGDPPLGLDGLDVSIQRMTEKFAAAIRRMGLSLVTYTCNTDEQVDWAIKLNVDGLITDRPGWALNQVRKGDTES